MRTCKNGQYLCHLITIVLSWLNKLNRVHSSDLMHTLCKQKSPYLQSQNYNAKPTACPISILIETAKEFLRNDIPPAEKNRLCCQRTRNNFYKMFLILIVGIPIGKANGFAYHRFDLK